MHGQQNIKKINKGLLCLTDISLYIYIKKKTLDFLHWINLQFKRCSDRNMPPSFSSYLWFCSNIIRYQEIALKKIYIKTVLSG